MFSRHKVKLDPALHERAVRRAEELGYASVEEYVTHVIERELSHLGDDKTRDELLERLRGLGYLE